IAGLYVPLPHANIQLGPMAAESAGYSMISFLAGELQKEPKPFHPLSKRWFDELMKHRLDVKGDGWVVRAVLKTGSDIVNSFVEHEFHAKVRKHLDGRL